MTAEVYPAAAEKRLVQLVGGGAELKNSEANGFRINYLLAGPPASAGGCVEPLILLHGLNIGWGQWYKNIPELARRFKVYALDLPGSGGSTKIDFGSADFENELVVTVEKFIEKERIESVAIIGHSIGGWVALRLALRGRTPISRMVLSNPLGLADYVTPWHWPVTIKPIAELLARSVMRPTRDNMLRFLTSVCRDKTAVEDIFADYFYESITRERLGHPLAVMNRLFRPFRLRSEFVLTDKLGMIEPPVRILLAERDFLIPPGKVTPIINYFKNARMEVFSGAGHVPFIEKPTEFNRAALEFLRPDVPKVKI